MALDTPAGLNGHSFDKISDPSLDVKPEDNDLASQKFTMPDSEDNIVYIQGTRFWAISAAVATMMFLTNLEVPVVITALVAITDDIGGFDSVGWVVASYLLGYVALIVICAKFSDIFGRKFVFLLSIAIFIIFSAACSAAQTIVQLIVFRAFQGTGGGACFSLCTIMIVETVPPEKYTKYVSNISVFNALSLLLGPIIGGAIASDTSWRWIFIINVPIAIPAFVMAFIAIPRDFPHHGQPNYRSKTIKDLMRKSTLDRVDIPGTALILFATLALTAAFEEADKQFPWRSAYVITLLTVSGVLWIILLTWERYVTLSNKIREPILPWTFLTNRQMVGIMLNFVLLGGPTVIGMFIIPQRFQLVYGLSGLQAGVRLIPFTVAIPVASIVASIIAGKLKFPPIYLIMIGSCLQVIGFALLGTLPSGHDIPPRIYGAEFITGCGCGINFSLLFILIPFVIEKRYQSVGMAAGAQTRMMGSAVVLAVSTSVFNTYARPHLQSLLGVSNSDGLLLSGAALASLPQELQEGVRNILAEGYNRQTLVLCVSAGLQVLASLLMWEKKQILV
ncbi:putative multidrug resistance protein fnx1 [Whalleya microplaca]|nr:putative multidrug resistance protein fnx1 [Whalleya microplaca]